MASALVSAWPEPRKKPAPRATRLDPYKPLIDQMLRADLDAPRKQQHTTKRIFDRLVAEHDAGELTYGIVRAYVARRRPEIRVEAGRDPPAVFVPQSHRPGVEAEVDFDEVAVRLAGEQVKCCLFAFRLSYSGKAVHRISASGGQEAFFEGHVHAFRVLGGVPTGKVGYDNLKAAVARVLGLSRARVETARWMAFRSHDGVEAFFCQPGIKGAHENAFAERWVGTVRRELLDRMLLLGRRHLEIALTDCVAHYNQHRPHRALGQAPPQGAVPLPAPAADARVLRVDRIGGLIHEYIQVA